MRVLPFSQFADIGILPRWPSFACKRRFIDLERDGIDEADVGWHAVPHGKRHEVAGEEAIGEGGEGMAIATRVSEV